MHLLLLVLLSGAQALFEDQAFKFDWKQSFIGHVTHAGFHTTARASVLVAATESHVLAGLDSDSGALLWRHAQEQDLVGAVRALHVGPKHAVSLSGEAPFLLLRIWDPVTGALVQEHLVRGGDSQPDLAGVTATRLVLLRWLDTGKLEITGHSFDSRRVAEAEVRQEKSPFPGAALAAGTADCLVTEELELACWHQSALHTLSLASPASAWARQDLGAPALGGLRASADGRLEVETEAGVARLEAGKVTLEKEAGLGVAMSGGCGGVAVRQACEQEGRGSAGGLYCRQHSRQLVVSSGAAGETVVHTLAEDRGRVERAWAGCEEDAWQLVLVMEDGALLSLTPRGNLMFLREEGLAAIQLVQMVAAGRGGGQGGHPPSGAQGATLDPARLLQSFVIRLKRHVTQGQALLLSLIDWRLAGARERAGQTLEDRFGLRKVVVVATDRGKLYGLDSVTGAVLWQGRVPGRPSALLLQRDGRTDPESAAACLVYRHHRSAHFVHTFNPVSGAGLGDTAVQLDLTQALLLPEQADSALRPVLLVGRDGRAELLPPAATARLASLPRLFVVTEDGESGLTGNLVTVSGPGAVTLAPVWSLASPGAALLHLATRQLEEKVHSAGRVMDDRSVLFKYMNPNLGLVMAEGKDSAGKSFITIQVIDLITGRIFFSATHKKVAPPFHAVLSENWAVYTYFNEKARRTELVSLELYEGKTQGNSSMFSSIENTVVPLVERQAYILPVSEVAALQETITEKGITAKHLLVATTQGAVLDLPVHMVDPRRPALNTPAHLREPGIPPYMPELPVPHESLLNYNRTVAGVRGITTSPSGLESTVLVFVHGLDLYGTRIAPSKGFDLIKDDFEHLMIAGVLVFLVAASFGTRKLAQRKMLNQAWK